MPTAMASAAIPNATSLPVPYPMLNPMTNPKTARKAMTTKMSRMELRRLADSSE